MTNKSRIAEPLPEPAPIADGVIYVVDDDVSVRESLGNLMRSVGLKVELFASAVEFRRHRRGAGPSCLVLDVRLPGISGLDLQSELNALGDRLPIVFITGHGDVPMSVRAMKGGALEFLQKPFREQDLLDAIHIALSKSWDKPDPGAGSVPRSSAPAGAGQAVESAGPRQALARNIQIGRTIFSWSQEELGAKCELHRSHISALEREELSVGVDAIDRIAAAFGIAPHVLLMPPVDSQSMLLEAFNGIDRKPHRAARGFKK